jgi:hypothetical protein
MWLWIALAGFGATVLVMGWRHNRWWRRGMSALTVPLCILCAALMLNQWVGYLPTVRAAWDRLTGAPVPGQTDRGAVSAMQQQGATPVKGTIVSVEFLMTHPGSNRVTSSSTFRQPGTPRSLPRDLS